MLRRIRNLVCARRTTDTIIVATIKVRTELCVVFHVRTIVNALRLETVTTCKTSVAISVATPLLNGMYARLCDQNRNINEAVDVVGALLFARVLTIRFAPSVAGRVTHSLYAHSTTPTSAIMARPAN